MGRVGDWLRAPVGSGRRPELKVVHQPSRPQRGKVLAQVTVYERGVGMDVSRDADPLQIVKALRYLADNVEASTLETIQQMAEAWVDSAVEAERAEGRSDG